MHLSDWSRIPHSCALPAPVSIQEWTMAHTRLRLLPDRKTEPGAHIWPASHACVGHVVSHCCMATSTWHPRGPGDPHNQRGFTVARDLGHHDSIPCMRPTAIAGRKSQHISTQWVISYPDLKCTLHAFTDLQVGVASTERDNLPFGDQYGSNLLTDSKYLTDVRNLDIDCTHFQMRCTTLKATGCVCSKFHPAWLVPCKHVEDWTNKQMNQAWKVMHAL